MQSPRLPAKANKCTLRHAAETCFSGLARGERACCRPQPTRHGMAWLRVTMRLGRYKERSIAIDILCCSCCDVQTAPPREGYNRGAEWVLTSSSSLETLGKEGNDNKPPRRSLSMNGHHI